MFFDKGTCWVLVTYFYIPKSARAYLFPNLTKLITFAAAPLVLTPFVRNQGPAPRAGSGEAPPRLPRGRAAPRGRAEARLAGGTGDSPPLSQQSQ